MGVVAALAAAADAAVEATGDGRVLLTATDGPDGLTADLLYERDAVVPVLPPDTSDDASEDAAPIELWAFPEAARYLVSRVRELPSVLAHIRATRADAVPTGVHSAAAATAGTGANDRTAGTGTATALASLPARVLRTPFAAGHTFVFVCTHKRRNNNCGLAGPILIQQFQETLDKRNLTNVHVFATSHIGGHRFAGTLIVYETRARHTRTSLLLLRLLIDLVVAGTQAGIATAACCHATWSP